MTVINNKSQFINNFNFSTFVILMISIVFALLIGGGIYGYGTDFHAAYHKPNLVWGGIFDRLGYRVATLSINGVHIGVQIVTFFLALSSGLLIREHIKFKQSFSLIFFILLLKVWCIVPYFIWKKMAQPKIKEIEFIATFRFAIAITLVPLWLGFVAILFAVLFSGSLAIYFIVSALIIALLAVKL